MKAESIRPLGAIVVLRQRRQRKTDGGILLPDILRHQHTGDRERWEVVAVGPGQWIDIRNDDLRHVRWEMRVPGVEVGEVVILAYEGGGFDLPIHDRDWRYVMVDCSIILAVDEGAQPGEYAA